MNSHFIHLLREGANPQKFIYNSDLLTLYQHNIHLVTEWVSNDGEFPLNLELSPHFSSYSSELNKDQNSSPQRQQYQVSGAWQRERIYRGAQALHVETVSSASKSVLTVLCIDVVNKDWESAGVFQTWWRSRTRTLTPPPPWCTALVTSLELAVIGTALCL